MQVQNFRDSEAVLVELVAVLSKISACAAGMQAIVQTEDVARRLEGVLNILNRQRKGAAGAKRPMTFGSDKVPPPHPPPPLPARATRCTRPPACPPTQRTHAVATRAAPSIHPHARRRPEPMRYQSGTGMPQMDTARYPCLHARIGAGEHGQ